MTHSYWL